MQVDDLYRLRHSLAHVLAMAVLEMRPGAKLGFGPPTEQGFYYDFLLDEPLTEGDLRQLEGRMKNILKNDYGFDEEIKPYEEALAFLEEQDQPFKREFAQTLAEREQLDSLGFYRTDGFVDLCRGPHVRSTRDIPADAFRLRSIAGAYWLGDSDNPMMTRIYGWAYPSRKELEDKLREHELALERDHRKLGRELDLFVIDDTVGKGLPLWLPNGAIVRQELEKLARELEFADGYVPVASPAIARAALYHQSGHLPYYLEHMYPPMQLVENRDSGEEEVRDEYFLRPMNCPHHHRIFAARPRSHRELPLRLAEYGAVFRYEDSGALSGLLRVRGMTMNDAHIYCTEEQIKPEFVKVMQLHQRVYAILGLESYYMRLSTWDPATEKGQRKYVDDPAAWEKTQRIVREAMDEVGVPYVEAAGEAAFYGPKIDVQFRTVTGREETASTNQLDFAQPERMGLTYTGPDNREHRPYVIHRAPLGTHERFIAFLIEHYGGAFPTWLAPVQVRVLTVSDQFREYAGRVVAELRADGVRAEVDPGQEQLGKAIRDAATRKIPNVLVVGAREAEDGLVTLRVHGSREQRTMPVAEFRALVGEAIRTRARSL